MIGAIIQARMGSTRLPGKVLKDLSGRPLLWHVVCRTRNAKSVEKVVVATSTNKEDDAIEKFSGDQGFLCYRGSPDNVLERYWSAIKTFGIDTVVRITAQL